MNGPPGPCDGTANVADDAATSDDVTESIEWQTVTLKTIAVLLLLGAAWILATILVPFLLAFVLTIALSPLADRLERGGFPRSLAALACTLVVAILIAAAAGLVFYQAGTIIKDSDKYIKAFGTKLDDLLRQTHLTRAATTFGLLDQVSETKPIEPASKKDGARERKPEPSESSSSRESAKNAQTPSARGQGEAFLRRGLNAAGGWLASGVGGMLGILGGGLLFLAYLYYMLEGRDTWAASLKAAGRQLGLRPAPGTLETVRHQLVMYVGCLSMIALAYAVVVSLILWMLKVPHPLLWGLLAGLLEVVPYFGPLVASVCPTIVSLSLGSWWQPLAVIGMFLTLHLVEGYLIEPKLYGRAVRLDPVTILFGAIFFGTLWGPAGLAIATPMLIILRGLILISPDTPALDTLAGVRSEKAG